MNRKKFGNLLMDIIQCEHLFEVIPTEEIPTYDEFMKYDGGSPEFSRLVDKYEKGVAVWFEKVFNALGFYLTLDSDEIKTELILSLIYVAGAGGQIKYNRKNKLSMVCRMLYRMFGINIREE